MDGQGRLSTTLRRVAIACSLVVALVLPATAAAEVSSAGSRSASKFCKALRADMGARLFERTYGERARRKCAAKHSGTVRRAQRFAVGACKAEREADLAEFRRRYGSRRNALGRCVSSRTKGLQVQDRSTITKAARYCRDARRSLGKSRFARKYRASARRAFGKCVFRHARDEEATS